MVLSLEEHLSPAFLILHCPRASTSRPTTSEVEGPLIFGSQLYRWFNHRMDPWLSPFQMIVPWGNFHSKVLFRPEPVTQIKLPIVLFQTFSKCSYYSPKNNWLFQYIHIKHFSDDYIATSMMSICSPEGRFAANHWKNVLKAKAHALKQLRRVAQATPCMQPLLYNGRTTWNKNMHIL